MEVLVLVVCQVACLTWAVLVVCQTWAVPVVLEAPLLRRSTKFSRPDKDQRQLSRRSISAVLAANDK